jgi:hypothetical protein
LDDFDRISLVRDRGSKQPEDGDDEAMDEDEEEEDEYEDAGAEHKAAVGQDEEDEPEKTEGQIQQERQWGLYRDDSTSDLASQTTKGDDVKEDSETEDEDLDWRRRERVSRIPFEWTKIGKANE